MKGRKRHRPANQGKKGVGRDVEKNVNGRQVDKETKASLGGKREATSLFSTPPVVEAQKESHIDSPIPGSGQTRNWMKGEKQGLEDGLNRGKKRGNTFVVAPRKEHAGRRRKRKGEGGMRNQKRENSSEGLSQLNERVQGETPGRQMRHGHTLGA